MSIKIDSIDIAHYIDEWQYKVTLVDVLYIYYEY